MEKGRHLSAGKAPGKGDVPPEKEELYKSRRRRFYPRRFMLPTTLRILVIWIIAFCALAERAGAVSDFAPVEAIISIADQKMVVLREGGWILRYPVSTSRFGIGDHYGSYQTPPGRLRVCEKLGGELPSGAVLKHREATGEILPANAPGRDPIVSRILWLEGLEPQNDHARGRGIYIHGTTEESNLGKAVSWGCIRMRSADVIEFFDLVPVGATITIVEGGLPHMAKWNPGASAVVASVEKWPPVVSRRTPPDARAANAFRGSILMAGLSAPPSAPAKRIPNAAALAPRLKAERFTLGSTPPPGQEFSLGSTMADPPLKLLDLRRMPLSPLLAFASIFEAPPPSFTSTWETAERGPLVDAPIY